MSPPLPPSPPSGPPYSTNFSRRKLTAPGPPAPERMKILAWSRKCMAGHVGQRPRNREPSGRSRLGDFPTGRARAAGGRRSRAPCRGSRPSDSAISAPEQRIAHRDEHEPQGRLGDRPVLMAWRAAGRRAGGSRRAPGSSASRLPERIIQAASAPAPSLPNASKTRSTISIGSASWARARRTAASIAGADPVADQPGERRLQARGRAEMVEQIGVGLADPRRDRLQRHRLRALLDQQARAPPRARRRGSLRGSGVHGY